MKSCLDSVWAVLWMLSSILPVVQDFARPRAPARVLQGCMQVAKAQPEVTNHPTAPQSNITFQGKKEGEVTFDYGKIGLK